MSLTRSGVWAIGVWATTVWADDVWYESLNLPTTASTGKSQRRRKPLGVRFGGR